MFAFIVEPNTDWTVSVYCVFVISMHWIHRVTMFQMNNQTAVAHVQHYLMPKIRFMIDAVFIIRVKCSSKCSLVFNLYVYLSSLLCYIGVRRYQICVHISVLSAIVRKARKSHTVSKRGLKGYVMLCCKQVTLNLVTEMDWKFTIGNLVYDGLANIKESNFA